jgi:hypothetical protein
MSTIIGQRHGEAMHMRRAAVLAAMAFISLGILSPMLRAVEADGTGTAGEGVFSILARRAWF